MGKMAEIAYDLERFGIGHNQPPGVVEAARDTMATLSDWMKDRPVIDNPEDASSAKALLDRAKGCAGEMEAERVRLVTPLNEKLSEINGTYKPIHNTDPNRPGTLDKVVYQLKDRLALFIMAEEEKRQAEAEKLRQEALEAERLAREAEVKEREAIDNAKNGELGVDVTQVVVEANSRFADFKKADRTAARAEKATDVKVGGGWGRRASLRTVETLILDDPFRAIEDMGVSAKLEEAILSAARDYRVKNEKLPSGISSKTERKL